MGCGSWSLENLSCLGFLLLWKLLMAGVPEEGVYSKRAPSGALPHHSSSGESTLPPQYPASKAPADLFLPANASLFLVPPWASPPPRFCR